MSEFEKDIQILRNLALRQQEHSHSDRNKKLKELWLKHNSYKGERPMLTVETDTFAQEILPQMMKCSTELGKK